MYAAKHSYAGEKAVSYELTRANQLSWDREYKVVDKLLEAMPPGSTILDMPCGTGRFFPLVHRYGHRVLGGDISIDMIRQVPSSRLELPALRGVVVCDAQRLPFASGSFDYVVCVRFFTLRLPPDTVLAALQEMTRIARRAVILQVPLKGRRLSDLAIAILATAGAEVRHARWHAPIELVKKAKEALEIIRKSRSDRFAGPPLSYTLPELEGLVEEVGFTVSKSYATESILRSKRIWVIERART